MIIRIDTREIITPSEEQLWKRWMESNDNWTRMWTQSPQNPVTATNVQELRDMVMTPARLTQ
jgi:hypothetical protein